MGWLLLEGIVKVNVYHKGGGIYVLLEDILFL